MNKYITIASLVTLVACGDRESLQLIPGIQGEAGRNGNDGTNGMDGTDGVNGNNGTDGVNGQDGATGPRGPRGPRGIPGRDGQDGDTGPVGPTGAQGVPGLNGTMFEVVRLCPSVSGSHPEVLFKIGGLFYALLDGGPHSDRLAHLPDGTYLTSDGRSCVFTVSGGNVL